MRILVAIVHHWNPAGGGRHQSLRPNAAPRVAALQQQILALCRLGGQQKHLNFQDQAAYPANLDQPLELDLHLITDGRHHVIEQLDSQTRLRLQHIVASPDHPLQLGFEAHRHLAEQLHQAYDLYAYVEDDLIIHDPCFFQKIKGFVDQAGEHCVLLPQRYETNAFPWHINKLYIDGEIPEADRLTWIPEPAPPLSIADAGFGSVVLESPRNPHAGCFILTKQQLEYWSQQSWWLDRDCSFITPLESAATLGLLKTFRLYKPSFSQAMWLEAQHWGTSFLGLTATATSEQPGGIVNG